jgi:hypothetical protein
LNYFQTRTHQFDAQRILLNFFEEPRSQSIGDIKRTSNDFLS